MRYSHGCGERRVRTMHFIFVCTVLYAFPCWIHLLRITFQLSRISRKIENCGSRNAPYGWMLLFMRTRLLASFVVVCAFIPVSLLLLSSWSSSSPSLLPKFIIEEAVLAVCLFMC